MLDILEKLINEHGSSFILRERLLLISEKYSGLEEVNSQQKDRITELESLLEMEKELVRTLQSEILSYKKNQEIIQLDKQSKEILRSFFDLSSYMDSSSVARRFNIGDSQAQYYIDILLKNGFLEIGPRHVGRPIVQHISQQGRKYVIEQLDNKEQ